MSNPVFHHKRLSILTAILLTAFQSLAFVSPVDLRCEYLHNPMGLDEMRPRLSWRLNSYERGQKQTAYRILVASSLSKLGKNEGDLWDSGVVMSDANSHVAYAGSPLKSRQLCYWKVRVADVAGKNSNWSSPAQWAMGLLNPADWQAEFISFRDQTPFHTNRNDLYLPPAQHYRKDFDVLDKVKRATVYATALGVYELEINGQKVGDAFFSPGWTDYRKRLYYQTYDVTPLLRSGENAIGAIVADGWYAGYVGYGMLVGYGPYKTGRNIYGKTPALLAQLEIEYADGTTKTITTDHSWKTFHGGPIREADILMGESYDARKEMSGWSQKKFDDQAWSEAVLAFQNGSAKAPFYDGAGKREMEFGFIRPARLQAYPALPARHVQELKAVAITSPKPGTYIFNLGQNFAGTVRLKAKGPQSSVITLRYGEMLHPDGRLMTENLRKARAMDRYTMKGDPRGEIWTPRFTFHGFQYVEVTGYPGTPELDAITGLVMHSDTPLTSSFECSDPMVNRLFKNVVWTQRANFLELPTDCPQRDEREGWMGDAQIYARTATYNADVAAFFTKWLREVEEAQLPSGAYPDYCPWPFQHGKAFATAWTDAGIIVPYTVWKTYGDTRIIETMWPSMTRFMEWRKKCSPDFKGVKHPDANTWGDWLNMNETTPIEFIDAAYYKWDANLMAQMARAIGRTQEAAAYDKLQGQIASQFLKDYDAGDGKLKVNTQTAYALTIAFGLRPQSQLNKTAELLAEKIAKNEFRMATGFLGTKPLLPALSAGNQNDLAVRLLQSRKFPSWGFEVENGATTIWERWDSFTKDNGFNGAQGNQNASMNSFAHYSFGAVCEWMFSTLAGIDTAGAGYRNIIIRPQIPTPGANPDRATIDQVKAHYDSMHGRVAVAWKNSGNLIELDVTIPVNTVATVHMPAKNAKSILEGSRSIGAIKSIKVLRTEGNCVIMQVGSGSYHFSAIQ